MYFDTKKQVNVGWSIALSSKSYKIKDDELVLYEDLKIYPRSELIG